MRTRQAILIAAFAAASAALAAPAGALSCTSASTCVQIEYGVSGSNFIPDVGQTIPITGSATLEYQAFAADDVQEGPVHVLGVTQSSSFDFTVTGAVRLTGATQVTALPSQSGALLFPGAVQPNGALLLGTLIASAMGTVHCFGFACGQAGLPNSSPVVTSGQTSTVANLIGTPNSPINATLLNGPHTFTFTGTGPMGTIGTTILSEVTRTFIPEPTSGSLLVLGLLGLAVSGRLGLRRLSPRA